MMVVRSKLVCMCGGTFNLGKYVRLLGVALITLLPVFGSAAAAEEAAKKDAFRVCADPNNLPFSNKNRQGFENRIADVLAKDLGLPVEYAWFPQRIGFVRNTLRAWVPEERRYKCDVIMGVASGFELAATTEPYYRSTYAMAYMKGRGLDNVKSAQDLVALPDDKKKSLKIGVFVPSPAVDWLLKHGLIDQAVPYQIQTGDPEDYPGKIIQKDLVAGKIDVAFVWGPIAGYFAKQAPSTNISVIALHSEPGVRFDYAIAMGVRQGEREWKETLQKAIERNQTAIQNILEQYYVPLVDQQGEIVHVKGAQE